MELPSGQEREQGQDSQTDLTAELLAIHAAQIESTPAVSSGEVLREIKPVPGESSAAYVLRASSEEHKPPVGVSLQRPSSLTESKLAPQILADADSLKASQSAPEVVYTHALAEITKLERASLSQPAPLKIGESGAENFDRTQRGRKLLERNRSGGTRQRHETYFHTLIAGSDAPEFHESLLRGLEGKTIVNLGGGNASIQAELREKGVDTNVINVEPYPGAPKPEGDKIVISNPAKEDFFESQDDVTQGSADEVWACFSVPFYLSTPDEIRTMLRNTKLMLKDNGVARIWPMRIIDSNVEGDELARQAALIAGIRELAEEGFAVDIVNAMGDSTLILQKSRPLPQ